jgi:recombination protein RecT
MNAVAKIPLRQVKDVKTLLHNDQARQQLAAVAARHMNPERMMRVVANAIRTTPKLQEADPLSFLGALMQCAALGIEPNSSMGHAYLVPFKNNRKGITEVQTIIGYKGLKALAWRSGSIDTMHADVVYSDDEEWSYGYGTDTHLRHKPGPQQGEKTHAYCHVKLKDGGQAFVVLPWSHVIRVRDASQNWKTAVKYNKTGDSPWSSHEDVMAAKTAVRHLFQRGDVPMSIEMADAMDIDHDEGARVDYASFAMNPDSGPIIEGEAEEDGAVQDEGSDADVIEGDAEEEKPKPEPEKKPAAKKAEKPKDEAKADDAKQGDGDEDSPFASVAERIMSDMLDGPVDAVLSMWENELNQMEKEAPKHYARVMDHAEATTKERGGD